MVRTGDRQAALLERLLALGFGELGVRDEARVPVSPIVVDEARRPQTRPGARPGRRRAPRTSSRSCRRRADGARRRTTSTGFAGSRSTGSPSVRIGITVTIVPPPTRPGAHRCGSASTRVTTPAAASRRISAPKPGTRSSSSATKHIVAPADARREQRPRRRAPPARVRARSPPATRNTGAPTGNPASARRAGLARGGTARVSRARAPGRRGRSGCAVCTMTRPSRAGPGRPPPSTSRAPARARPRPAGGGDASASQDRDEVQPRRAQVLQRVGAADDDLAFERRPGWVVATDQRHGHGRDAAGPLLDALGAPPRRMPKSVAPHDGAPPRRLADHAPDAAAFERGACRRTPRRRPAPRRSGRRGRRRSRGAVRARTRAWPRGARGAGAATALRGRAGPPRPAAHASPRGFDQDVLAGRGLERRAEGAEDAHGALDPSAHRGRRRGRGRRERVPRDARVALAMHVEQPEVDERREHRGTRPHDDSIAAGARSRARCGTGRACRRRGTAPRRRRTPSTSAAAVAGTGSASGTITIGRAPGRERRADARPRRRLLVLGRRPNDERARPPRAARRAGAAPPDSRRAGDGPGAGRSLARGCAAPPRRAPPTRPAAGPRAR